MENKKKISIASDHAGTELKSEVVSSLKIDGYDVLDNGPFNENSVDYPDYAKIVASDINESRCDFGILIPLSTLIVMFFPLSLSFIIKIRLIKESNNNQLMKSLYHSRVIKSSRLSYYFV